MAVYVLAQISIHDKARYERYVVRFPDVLTRYGGALLVADTAPDVVEGDWGHDKAILMRFRDRQAFETWATSKEYREIARDRVASTTGVVMVLKEV